MKRVGCVVVLGGLVLVLLCNLAPGLLQQLQASPMGTLFANPLKVGDVQQPIAQVQQPTNCATRLMELHLFGVPTTLETPLGLAVA